MYANRGQRSKTKEGVGLESVMGNVIRVADGVLARYQITESGALGIHARGVHMDVYTE